MIQLLLVLSAVMLRLFEIGLLDWRTGTGNLVSLVLLVYMITLIRIYGRLSLWRL